MLRLYKRFYFPFFNIYNLLKFKSFFISNTFINIYFLFQLNFFLNTLILCIRKNYSFYFLTFYVSIFYLNKFIIQRMLLSNFFMNNIFLLQFTRYKFFLKIGLSFKKKFIYTKNEFVIYIGLRHWLRFKPLFINFYFNVRRKNLVLFVKNIGILNYYLCITKCFRKESIFKTKGIMFSRVWIRKKIPRGILFARRIRFYIIKLKLSKKQKFI